MSDVSTITEERPQLPPVPEPHPSLAQLRPLVGTWRLEGTDASGEQWTATLRREFMEGGYYLVEHVDPGKAGGGMQFVGYDPANDHLKGSYYSGDGPGPFGGIALEYVWEVDGDDVTIWCGGVGTPPRYTGTISDDGRVITGSWSWPGGGYDAVETRID